MDGENAHMDEYFKAMTALRCGGWPLLKKHLCTSEGDLVLAALKTYVAAFEAYDEARAAFDKYRFDPTCPFEEVSKHMDELERLRQVYLSASDTQNVTYLLLMKQLLGEEVYTPNFGR